MEALDVTACELARCAAALERIADVAELLTPVESVPPCAHPARAREVMPGATMTDVTFRCTVCGAEGIP